MSAPAPAPRKLTASTRSLPPRPGGAHRLVEPEREVVERERDLEGAAEVAGEAMVLVLEIDRKAGLEVARSNPRGEIVRHPEALGVGAVEDLEQGLGRDAGGRGQDEGLGADQVGETSDVIADELDGGAGAGRAEVEEALAEHRQHRPRVRDIGRLAADHERDVGGAGPVGPRSSGLAAAYRRLDIADAAGPRRRVEAAAAGRVDGAEVDDQHARAALGEYPARTLENGGDRGGIRKAQAR